MNVESTRLYCLSKPGTTEDTPFGEDVLVFKVMGKMFALTNLSRLPLSVALKCDPERAVDLRERYDAIVPPYHMNKVHWNEIIFDGSVPDALIRELIDHSYDLVVAGLKKVDRERLAAMS
jgi:predicted DNA-binding protein (MmcQ/YjbR family)